jgi:hypothetical protein
MKNLDDIENFEVITDKFDIVRICTSGSDAQKCVYKSYSY